MAEPTNSLARAASSYLRSAMHQPVEWHEWSADVFDKAQRENKPVLLDVGAVWCHWCHVMDRESYENPEIAKLINDNYIAVKVDRDERPDVDSRYQAAVQAISGQGGWPLTAFLTPDGRPFFGGTYFPPEDYQGRPGFKRVLLTLASAYREKHSDVVESAEHVMTAIDQAESFAGRSGEISMALVDGMIKSAIQSFDSQNGGFGSAPKFPHPSILDLLIDHCGRQNDPQALEVVTTTLDHMAHGGVYDQLAGGFHRYSVDERWVVPHFEKMSYDNSELLKNYVHAYQLTGNEFYADVARDIIRWMDEWLSDRERGGFYASQDADIDLHDDGDYFTWSLVEAREVLNPQELEAATFYYDIGEVGEMHHRPEKNVLHIRATPEQIAARMKLSADEVRQLLSSAKRKMLEARLRRPTPYIDETMYVNWNALCVSAYLEAAKVLQLDGIEHFALRSLDRLLADGWSPERGLKHVIAYSDQPAQLRQVDGVLDDYAFLTISCLDAYEATTDLSYYRFAERIASKMVEFFHDETGGGFFDNSRQAMHGNLGALAARRKPLQDSPTPAGNPAAAIALLRLYEYSGEIRRREVAESTLKTFAGIAGHFGIFAATYGLAVTLHSQPQMHVIVVGNDAKADEMLRAAIARYSISKSVLRFDPDHVVAENLPPSLAQTIPNLPAVKEKGSIAVVCSGFTCRPPADSSELLTQLLEDHVAERRAS
ncbi:MAG TPA: thioredoxin domain-containing protein [Terriglobales bacterium]|nr:thioredoxin domain-containing protein [Terriglobales bacterium]